MTTVEQIRRAFARLRPAANDSHKSDPGLWRAPGSGGAAVVNVDDKLVNQFVNELPANE